ncbi:MAG: NAD-dependent epimerase/dehydratase family protein [Verrucomicrobiota bacterium]|jgi:UDP-glucose 4-epimerase
MQPQRTEHARILVTGAAGFLGSHLARHLAATDASVVCLDDLSGGFKENLPAEIPLIVGSIEDASLIDRLFEEHRFTHVCHLAAYAAEGLSHFIRGFNYRNNLLGSIHLINAAIRARVQRFLFTSSIAVYGDQPAPVTEATPPHPIDPYGIAKLAVEMDLQAANAVFGLPYTILRPHNVYGEGQNLGDAYRNVVGIFMNQLLQGRSLSIFGDGSQQRAFTHVDDFTPTAVKALLSPLAKNQIFDIGSDDPRTVLELAHITAKAFGITKPEIQFLPARQEAHTAFSSHHKLKHMLNFQPRISLEQGVVRMAAWARAIGPRQTRPHAAIEIHEGLPPSWAALS